MMTRIGLVCGLFAWAPASAHVGDLLLTVDIATVPDDPIIDVEMSVGLLLWDGQTADWVCHEAVTHPDARVSPGYARSTDNVRLAWLFDAADGLDGATLHRSEDGCDWTPVTAVLGGINFATYNPADAQQAFVLGTDGLLESADGGQTFVAATPTGWSSPLDGWAWAGTTGSAYLGGADEGGLTGQIAHTPDAGQTWTVVDIDLPPDLLPPIRVRPKWADPDNPDVALVAVQQAGTDTLLRTDDGGATWIEVLESPIALLEIRRGPDGVLTIVGGSAVLMRSVDGITWTQHDAPIAVGLNGETDVLLLGTSPSMGTSVVEQWNADSSTVELLIPEQIVGPLACPAGTDQEVVCVPLWELLEPRLRPMPPSIDTGDGLDTDDTGVGEPANGCGCGQSEGTAWMLLLPWALFFRRRGSPTSVGAP
jgi:photosystem II stability/assembly factor-like uncharacterized protein